MLTYWTAKGNRQCLKMPKYEPDDHLKGNYKTFFTCLMNFEIEEAFSKE